jgi:hypothetical protein
MSRGYMNIGDREVEKMMCSKGNVKLTHAKMLATYSQLQLSFGAALEM